MKLIDLIDRKCTPVIMKEKHSFQRDKFVITGVEKRQDNKLVVHYWAPGYTFMYSNYYAFADWEVEIDYSNEGKKLVDQYKDWVINQPYALKFGKNIGSDPEIFVENDNGIIPAFNFLGSKDKPSMTGSLMRTNRPIYWDGFQAEFDTEPNVCLAWHVDSIQGQLKNLLRFARQYDPNARLSSKTTVDIDPKIIETTEDKYVQFGCMPSFNVYGIEGMKLSGREVNFRSAGGHIHFGWGKLDDASIKRVVKSLDNILGIACVSLFESMDDKRRRTMYGLAGEYRLPAHGLEYRTLSNAWMCHPLVTNIIFDLARISFMAGLKGVHTAWKVNEGEVIQTIQDCDVDKARKILKDNEELFIKLLQKSYGKDAAIRVSQMFMKDVSETINNPKDVNSNWKLDSTGYVEHCEGVDHNVRNFVNNKIIKAS